MQFVSCVPIVSPSTCSCSGLAEVASVAASPKAFILVDKVCLTRR